jgi:hypothetical protein
MSVNNTGRTIIEFEGLVEEEKKFLDFSAIQAAQASSSRRSDHMRFIRQVVEVWSERRRKQSEAPNVRTVEMFERFLRGAAVGSECNAC